jgi:Transglycosylase-like domain
MAGRRLAVVLFVAPLVAALATPAGTAAAGDQVSSLQHQIAALQSQAVSSASRVRQLTLQYDQASLQASGLAQQVNSDEASVSRLTVSLAAGAARLRQALILGYVGEYAVAPGASAVTGGAASDPSVREAYISVASGTLQDAVDAYRSTRAQLATSEAGLVTAQRADEEAATAAGQARLAALAAAGAAQDELDHLQARLTVLQEQAAAAAAAARAPQPPPVHQTQGVPVGGGLVSVVRAEVGTASTASAPSPHPTFSAPATTASAPTAPVTAAPPAPSTPRAPSAPPPPSAPPVTAAPAAPTTTVAPSPPAGAGGGGAGGVWLELRQCESGDNYQANTGNGYYGAYQFSEATWVSLGYPGRPDLEPPAMQDQAAMRLQAQSGWGQWPACAAALGLA